MVITGADPSGATMFSAHPIITVLTCLIKGILAGYLSALTYKCLKVKNEKIRVAIGKANQEVKVKEQATEEEINNIILYIEDLKKMIKNKKQK